ncbi:Protein bric-a-brac 2 [Frankliniella fusca]|uniref:Protein bric-a-brac 2 n=1 Tax=Frankliniella fusca TaxID=407009 RepID=A0AAE1GUE5_9NEOP|nr:Protein bric-a-brac 2 [Frankliniella fusca]
MAAEQFCLRWNNFQSNIASALGSLKAEQDLVDVTLTCGGKSVKAHKVILSACSPYFRSVFKENPCQHPVVILKDVRYEDVLALLSFMYQGEVFITQDQLSTFLETAELLQVRGLTGASSPVKETPQQKSGQGSSLAPPPLSNIQKTFSKVATITPSPGSSPLSRSSSLPSHQSKQASNSSKRPIPPPARSSSPASDTLINKEHLSAPSSPQHVPKRRKATPRRVSTSSLASSDAGTENANSNSSGLDPSRISDDSLALLENVSVNISEVKPEPVDPTNDSGTLENDMDNDDDGEVYNDHEEDDRDNEHGEDSRSAFYMEMDESNEAGTSSLLARSLAGVSPRSTDGGHPMNNQTSATDLTASDGGREGYFSNWSGGTLLNMENFNYPFHNGNALESSNGLNRRTTSSWSCMQPRSCTHCNRTFSNKFNLKQHIENVHTPSQALPCHICNRSFKNKWYLRKHSVTAHGAPLRRIKTSGGKIVYVNEATSITPFYINNKVDA